MCHSQSVSAVHVTGLPGVCNLSYNMSLNCAMASPSQLPSSSSGGYNAAVLHAAASARWWGLLVAVLLLSAAVA